MFLTVQMAMIPLPALVVETDDPFAFPTIIQAVLEEMRASRNRLRHLPDDNFHDGAIRKDLFRSFKQNGLHDDMNVITKSRCQILRPLRPGMRRGTTIALSAP